MQLARKPSVRKENMKPKIILLALTGLLCLIVVIWRFSIVDSKKESVRNVTTDNQALQTENELAARMNRLEMENRRMRREVYSIQSNNTSPSANIENTDEATSDISNNRDEALSQEEQAKHDAFINSQILATMSNALEVQEDDPNWSDAAYKVFETSIQQNELKGTRIDEVQCKESLCRMEFSHDGTEDFESFRAYGLKGEMLAAGFYFSYDVNTNTSTVYMAKQGYTLPPPPAITGMME